MHLSPETLEFLRKNLEQTAVALADAKTHVERAEIAVAKNKKRRRWF